MSERVYVDPDFPYMVALNVFEDGTPVVDITTDDVDFAAWHEGIGRPYLRVWVNEDLVYERDKGDE